MKFKPNNPPYIIAEIGSNHNGDMELAYKLIDSAKECGCDCVKFQLFDTRLFANEVYERSGFLDDGRDLKSDLKMAVEKYTVTVKQLAELNAYCEKVKIDFSTSVFEAEQADDVAKMEPAFIKIASMDVNNDYLLKAIANTKKTVILSSGMASMAEMAHAVEILENEGCKDLAILHCVSMYPPSDETVNLKNMDMFVGTFGYTVGFSDHTTGTAIPLAAIARGAAIIEKHFTLDRNMEGWDHAMSADPEEMKCLVEDAHRIYAALGVTQRKISSNECEMRTAMRRSIVSACKIPAGKVIEASDLTYRRPGTGIEPNMDRFIIGMKAVNDIEADVLLQMHDVGVEGNT